MKEKRPKPVRDPFRAVSAQEASRSKDNKPTLTTRREASSIYIDFLHLNSPQLQAIEDLYEASQTEEHQFRPMKEEQVKAAACLASHRLDLSARELVSNRWSIKWSKKSGKGVKETKRVLYQWCVTIHPRVSLYELEPKGILSQ